MSATRNAAVGTLGRRVGRRPGAETRPRAIVYDAAMTQRRLAEVVLEPLEVGVAFEEFHGWRLSRPAYAAGPSGQEPRGA